jgi:chlorobactene glucosyltransferase
MSSAFLLGICLFLGALLAISLSNRFVLRRLGDHPDLRELPKVSILVPARNEEANIEACIRSLLAQNYPDFEVLVLDDESEDRTFSLVAELSGADSQLRVFRGKPLPEGWLGKSWACAQLAGFARGKLLLFTDADTVHEPDTAASAVAALQSERADLLAVWPRLMAESLGEKLLVPLIPWSVFSILSLAVAHRLRFPALSAAIGQYLLFRRAAYFDIGGPGVSNGTDFAGAWSMANVTSALVCTAISRWPGAA